MITFCKQLSHQVTILNTNNLHTYGLKYFLIISDKIYLTIEETLTGTTSLGQSEWGNNSNKEDIPYSTEF